MIFFAVLSGIVCALIALKLPRQAAWVILLPVFLGMIGLVGWWIEARDLICLSGDQLGEMAQDMSCGFNRFHLDEAVKAAPMILYFILGHILVGTISYLFLRALNRLMEKIDNKLAPKTLRRSRKTVKHSKSSSIRRKEQPNIHSRQSRLSEALAENASLSSD